jgi:dTDP-4-amino-4,6-dideoxygalactose transaminase
VSAILLPTETSRLNQMPTPLVADNDVARETLYFARPSAQYRRHQIEIDAAMQRVLDGHVYIMGDEVKAFEAEFAAWTGAKYGIAVANGTDALHLSLRALGIGAGDEVITTAHTAVASIAAIEMSGATPIMVDVTDDRFCLDPEMVARAITPRTKAIMPVHLYGHPADMGPLLELGSRHGLKLVEDCAQAHGAEWQGRQVGTIGDVGCYSLYPTKNLGALGDGGVIVTSDAELAEKLRMMRQYGWRDRQFSEIQGFNSRLDEIQAAVLRVKLNYLASGNARRRDIAMRYSNGLKGLPLTLPEVQDGCEAVFHLYVLRTSEREALKTHLAAQGVVAGIHYPIPCHQHPAYAERFGAESRPVAEMLAGEILSLPMYPELRNDQVDRVIDAVRGYFALAVAAD